MPEESTPLDLHNFALSGITGVIGTAANIDVVLASVDLVRKGVLDTNDLVTIKAALDAAAAAAAETEESGSGESGSGESGSGSTEGEGSGESGTTEGEGTTEGGEGTTEGEGENTGGGS